MSPSIRKLALLGHVATSVGWLGAVVAFLVLAVVGLADGSSQLARACYAVMAVLGWSVIVPLAAATLLTGVMSSLGTGWGLFRYYWVVVKLVITVVATVVLLVHMGPITTLAGAAAEPQWTATSGSALRPQLVVQSSAAVIALLVATGLSVYKPPGRTSYGLRRLQRERRSPLGGSEPANGR